MQKMTLWLFLGVLLWDVATCSKCPDGSACSDRTTCCLTHYGYSCCPYPNAVCCSDQAHCCPSGFRCNLLTKMCEKEQQPWIVAPMTKKEGAPDVAEEPPRLQKLQNSEPKKSSYVYCDSYSYCNDGYTCCRGVTTAWWCCPYTYAYCCLDRAHCCPTGYFCDSTYTSCLRQGLRYPFSPKLPPSSVPASIVTPPEEKDGPQEKPMTALTDASVGASEVGVIRCDSDFYCPADWTCCKNSVGQWTCCPYQLGQCCSDGSHCCQYGFTCADSSCKKTSYSQVLSGNREKSGTL